MTRPSLRTAVAVGLVAMVAVVGLGLGAVATSPQQWTADASLAVFPNETDAGARASFYETLSRGQIVATIADLLRTRLDVADGGPSPDIRVVPNTSIITITATADEATSAQDVANAGLDASLDHIDALGIPFIGVVVGQAETASRSGISPWTMMAATTFAGAAVGLGLAQAVLAIGRSTRRRVVTAVDQPPTPLRRTAADP